MDMFDFAGMLFGGSRTAPDATTVTATGAGASDGGEVGITLDADVTPAEDTGVEGDADQTIIDLPTSPDVDEGDELIVTLVGEGPLKTPVVTANPGSGDRMRTLVNAAQAVADAAQAVAEAVNQHFFADGSGIHVTEATQEDWDANHSGANVLINALGQLFRDGLNNLLTLTTEDGARALTIWDGLGNAAENVLAIFGASETRLGLGGGTGSIFLASDKFRLRGVTKDRTWSSSGASGTVREAFGNILSETVWDGPNQSESWDPSTDYSYVSRSAVDTYSYVPTDHAYGGKADLKLSANVYDWKGESPETSDLYPEEDNGFDPYISQSHSDDVSIELHAESINPDNNYIALRADMLMLDGAVQRTEDTCTAITANATIMNGVNHCWTNNATTTITVGVNLKSSLANSGAVAVATAPANFRPPYTVVGSVYVTSANAINLQAWIDSAGKITVNNRSGSTVSTSANIYISFTFAP